MCFSSQDIDNSRLSKFCSDFSFWKVRCLSNDQNATTYVEARRCNTYKDYSYSTGQCPKNQIFCPKNGNCLSKAKDCSGGIYIGNETQCENQNMYHCPKSNQCIWQDWVCDGFVQCLEGDDEDFNLCHKRKSFAEGATVQCAEANRFGYEVTILATKCDGVKECKDRKDEKNCENDDTKALIAIGIFLAVIIIMWIAIYLMYDDMNTKDEEPSTDECVYAQSLTGDSLALLKVSLR